MRFAAFCITALWLATMGSTFARGNFGSGSWMLDPLTKTQVQIYSPYDSPPDRGFLPVKAVIRNGNKREITFNFSFTAECNQLRFTSSFSVKVPKTSEHQAEFMVPLPTALEDVPNHVKMRMTSFAGSVNGQLRGLSKGQWASLGMSKGVDGRDNLKQLSDHLRSKSIVSGYENVGLLFEPKDLIADWRAYVGLDILLLTDKEWLTLEPSVRREILAWNRMGGHLHLFTQTPNVKLESFGIDASIDSRPNSKIKKSKLRSMGQVFLHNWNGDRIPVEQTAQLLNTRSNKQNNELLKGYASKWGLQNAFGFINFNPIAVFIILIAFAITVGPINLFVWAKPGMRHRLFFTTPIISFIASLLLGGLIVLKDGFGGSGQRIALMLLQSNKEERRSYVIQEQIARTGVLMGKSFKLEDPTFITPAVLNLSKWTHFDNQPGYRSASYAFSSPSLAGDWFQSRSEQAHAATTVRPTRARIERLPAANDGTPRFFSSIDFALDQFWYTDQAGKVWRSTSETKAGQEIELVEAATKELEDYWNTGRSPGESTTVANNCALFTTSLRNRARTLLRQRDTFFASASGTNCRDQMIPTLGSIRWGSRDRLLVVGQPVDQE